MNAPIAASQLTIPPLAEGEIYIGAIGNAQGELYHLILLPGDNDDATWQEQLDWAKSIGGDLPNRIEQAMLFDGFKDQFKADWYWSNKTCHFDDDYAWYQYFLNGGQDDFRKSYCHRARAVRRLPI